MKTLIVLLSAGVIALACAAGAQSAFARDGAIIRNSGSTNFAGYTIKFWSDGTAQWQPSGRQGTLHGQVSSGTVPKDVVQKFFHDVAEARNNRTIAEHCMKSASFGSTTVVLWHGWTSPDLQCPGGGYIVSLANDVNQVIAALGVHQSRAGTPLVRPGRPMPEQSASPGPSASPEPDGSPS